MDPLDKVEYEPWDDLHAPQFFSRVDPTKRTTPLYIGEPEWHMNADVMLYLASFFVVAVIIAVALT